MRLLLICLLVTIPFLRSNSQDLPKPENFSVPSSGAFNLLDVNPTKVSRPGFAKDFKFDWFIKNNQIAPNIALETQPVWLLFFGNIDYKEYKKLNPIVKALSTLDFSLGTSDKFGSNSSSPQSSTASQNRGLAFAFKLNLYSKKNPMDEQEYIDNSVPPNSPLVAALIAEKGGLEAQLNKGGLTDAEKTTKQNRLVEINKILESDDEAEFKKINKFREAFQKANWNADIVDIGYGQVYNYFGENLSNLTFDNKGEAFWVSGIKGIGKKVMLNGMFKFLGSSVKPIRTIGANFRYGSYKANFFVEYVNQWSNPNDDFLVNTISYGGDFKVNNLFFVQFGLRTEYNKDMTFKGLLPLINVNYLMNN